MRSGACAHDSVAESLGRNVNFAGYKRFFRRAAASLWFLPRSVLNDSPLRGETSPLDRTLPETINRAGNAKKRRIRARKSLARTRGNVRVRSRKMPRLVLLGINGN